jgi:hypothetical protein
MTTETEKSPREIAQGIIKHISDAALELGFVRHDLTSGEVDCDDDADVDPEELDATSCELIWLQRTTGRRSEND